MMLEEKLPQEADLNDKSFLEVLELRWVSISYMVI